YLSLFFTKLTQHTKIYSLSLHDALPISAEFVEAAQAHHVIAQAARWNRYGHPAPAVERRWQANGAMFWNTGLDGAVIASSRAGRSEEHTSELQSRENLVCRLLLEKKK